MEHQNTLEQWERPRWSAARSNSSSGDAELLYVVFGDFPQPLHLSGSDYRTSGLPDCVELRAFSRATQAEQVQSFYAGWLGQSLRSDNAALFSVVERASTCLVLRGTIPDPPSLLYLRDVVGVLTALLDNGSGSQGESGALLDSQALAWFSPDEWRERIYEPDSPVPTHHVSILVSPEPHEERHQHASVFEQQHRNSWLHTRGMRKFGRPDLSIHDVAPEHWEGCLELCNRLIIMQAFGEHVAEGQAIRMKGVPVGMTCHHQGSYDDPEFNNVHIEVRRAA